MSFKSNILKNVLSGFVGQIIIIILGLIIPRIMISYYGSDANGLLSTIIQIFSYMALLEAGIGQATKNLLFEPIISKNKDEISRIVSASTLSFRKMSVFYGIGVVALSCVAPLVLKSNIDRTTISFVIFFEGLAGVISFSFVQTITVFLAADGKGFVINTIELISKILIYCLKILMAVLGVNIAILQAVSLLITIGKVCAYKWYFKRKYGWVHFGRDCGSIKLKDRNSYVLTEIAGVIFSSTDMIVLSVFYSTSISSVYSVYNMIFLQITNLVNAVFASVSYMLGQAYHRDLKEYMRVHDVFNSVFLAIITSCMCVCVFLTIPFVQIYTKDVIDTNYIFENLPVLFCVVQLFSWSRIVTGNLTGLAGYAKLTSIVSMIEAGINLILSIVLVPKYGIVGVLFATAVALPVKIIWCLYVSDKLVMKRSFTKSFGILGVNYLIFGVAYMASKAVSFHIENFFQFLVYAAVLTVLIVVITFFLNSLINKDCYSFIKGFLKRSGGMARGKN